MLHALVLAGGSGTRFWPASRAALPKQLLALAGERTMLQSTIDRLEGLAPAGNVLCLTNARLAGPIREQLPNLPAKQIIGEPCKRDTAPAIGLAAAIIARADKDATMAVMPSDHVIEPREAFQQAIRQAADLVEQDPRRLVTFGIRPTYPAESFGYIERGEAIKGNSSKAPVYRVARFREKPPAAVAEEYVASGNFYWNAGIFVWKARTILEELRKRQPEMVEHLERIANAWNSPQREATLVREFAAIRGVSIDYAVMEHAESVLVVEAPFTWDDLGSWKALERLRGVDADGNTIVGKHLGVETSGTIVRGTDDHLVVTLGVSDLVVVHTPDATLVASKSHEESVRHVIKLIEDQGWQEYL